jgi:hypothetical protein
MSPWEYDEYGEYAEKLESAGFEFYDCEGNFARYGDKDYYQIVTMKQDFYGKVSWIVEYHDDSDKVHQVEIEDFNEVLEFLDKIKK